MGTQANSVPAWAALGAPVLDQARIVRGTWLAYLADGVFGLEDLLAEAATDEGFPLRRLRLHTVLAAMPEFGDTTARRVVDKLVDTLPGVGRRSYGDITVGWVMDGRSGGRRLLVLLDVLRDRNAAVSWGSPFGAHPTRVTTKGQS